MLIKTIHLYGLLCVWIFFFCIIIIISSIRTAATASMLGFDRVVCRTAMCDLASRAAMRDRLQYVYFPSENVWSISQMRRWFAQISTIFGYIYIEVECECVVRLCCAIARNTYPFPNTRCDPISQIARPLKNLLPNSFTPTNLNVPHNYIGRHINTQAHIIYIYIDVNGNALETLQTRRQDESKVNAIDIIYIYIYIKQFPDSPGRVPSWPESIRKAKVMLASSFKRSSHKKRINLFEYFYYVLNLLRFAHSISTNDNI